jgi:hypothetical protein
MQQSAQNSESYNEVLHSKYREKCSRLQEELTDTKARLSASESRVQNLEVLPAVPKLSSFQIAFNVCVRAVSVDRPLASLTRYQDEVRQLKELLDSAHQELYGQPAAPTLACSTNRAAVAIDMDSDNVTERRPQLRSRTVLLQPCLSNSKSQ